MLERHVGASELEEDHAESVAIDRVRRVDVDRLLKGSECARRLLVVEIAQRAIIGRTRLQLLNLSLLLRLLRAGAPDQDSESQQSHPNPVSS
jgi:hypothetical protein